MTAKRCPVCDVDTSREHSDPERRRHFAVIRAAFDHWPATVRLTEQITGPEDLRAYLYCKVGYRTEIDVDMSTDPDAVVDFILKLSREMGKKVFVRIQGTRGKVFLPKSARKADCPHEVFWRLAGMVDDEIEKTLGVKVDRLLRERETA